MSEKSIEQSMKDCIRKELESGIIEKVIKENLEECINNSMKSLFSYSGSIRKVIDEKIEETIVPYLESYDYSKYVLKLDTVMTNILKETTLDNRAILNNFSDLMTTEKIKEIKISDIFAKWCEYCAAEIDTDKIPDYDFEGGYINCNMEVIDVSQDWSVMERKKVELTCENDDDLKMTLEISKYGRSSDNMFSLYYPVETCKSLKNLNKMEILLLRLSKLYDPIILDEIEINKDEFVEHKE